MSPDTPHKTGLFFGSFDPAHLAHLIIAEYLLAHKHVSEIWFVISPQNPLKADKVLTHHHLRKEMMELAIENQEQIRVCDIEFDMPFPHYTHKTLLVLKEMYPDKDFALIIGSDNLHIFDQWKNYREILEMIDILVYPRPGHGTERFMEYARVRHVNAPMLEISSSYIRKSFVEGFSARYMLPVKVFDYIQSQGLYRPTAD